MKIAAIALVLAIAIGSTATRAEPSVTIHYAPAENLERVDGALIGSAKRSIDMAAYVLTDWPVIDELVAAHRRGIAVRIVLDPSQPSNLARLAPLVDVIRMKPRGAFMHLKSYSVDGETLRTGSANLTASGLKQQENDIVILRDKSATEAFERVFADLWRRSRPVEQPMPREQARAMPLAASEAAGDDRTSCAIKGNVNRKGERIYHAPESLHYARIDMATGSGKRWFCSEAEAVAAGWRKAGERRSAP